MANDMTLEIVGMERLQKKLNDPGLILAPLGEMLQEAGRTGQQLAVQGIDGGTGVAVRSINFEAGPTSMRLFSAMPRARALNIDEGRPPNDPMLSLGPIIKWRDAVAHPDLGIVIFRELRRRGVRGRFFMAAAKNGIQERLPQWLQALGTRINRRWEE